MTLEFKKIRLLFATLLLITGGVFAIGADAYMSPGRPTGFVNDFANILTPQTQTVINAELTAFEREKGHEIAVVTIPTLDNDSIEEYAVALFADWGIGKKGADNGVLLLIARDDRKMRIEVGYGLEGALTDAESSQIIRNILTPAFRLEEYDRGIEEAVQTIERAIAEEIPIEAEPIGAGLRAFAGENVNFLFWVVLILFTWVSGFLAKTKQWWLGGVIGAILGLVVGVILFTLLTGLLWGAIAGVLGILYDLFASRNYQNRKDRGLPPTWWMGGGFGGGGSGGGFGGFGGGGSGGGGSSGGW